MPTEKKTVSGWVCPACRPGWRKHDEDGVAIAESRAAAVRRAKAHAKRTGHRVIIQQLSKWEIHG